MSPSRRRFLSRADSWSGTPQQLLAHTKSELARWQKAVDLAGAKLPQ